MKNIAIKALTIVVFILLGLIMAKAKEVTFSEGCLLFIVVLLGLQIFKE